MDNHNYTSTSPLPNPTNWTWGDPIDYKFNWQNPHNYIQFCNALWERWLATSLSAVGDNPRFPLGLIGPLVYIPGWVGTPDYDTSPWAVPPKMNMSPLSGTKVIPKNPPPKPPNLQNTSVLFNPTSQFLYNPYTPTDTTIIRPGFNYKGIGELESVGYWILLSNFVDPSKVDPTTYNINATRPYVPQAAAGLDMVFGWSLNIDPHLFIANNFDFSYSNNYGAKVAPLLGQKSYPRRRRPREINGYGKTITSTGGSSNSTLAPVGTLAYGVVGQTLTSAGFRAGLSQHAGGGTWNQITTSPLSTEDKPNPKTPDILDSEYPTDHASFIYPGLMQIGDIIDQCKFQELYQICKICQTTAMPGRLYSDDGTIDYYDYHYSPTSAWDDPTLNKIYNPIPFNHSYLLCAANNTDDNPSFNVKWKLGWPYLWKGCTSQIKYYTCVRPIGRFDDQGAGFTDQRWNLWDTQNIAGDDPTFSKIMSKEWNPAGGPPSRSHLDVPPPNMSAGLEFIDFMIMAKWTGFTYK